MGSLQFEFYKQLQNESSSQEIYEYQDDSMNSFQDILQMPLMFECSPDTSHTMIDFDNQITNGYIHEPPTTKELHEQAFQSNRAEMKMVFYDDSNYQISELEPSLQSHFEHIQIRVSQFQSNYFHSKKFTNLNIPLARIQKKLHNKYYIFSLHDWSSLRLSKISCLQDIYTKRKKIKDKQKQVASIDSETDKDTLIALEILDKAAYRILALQDESMLLQMLKEKCSLGGFKLWNEESNYLTDLALLELNRCFYNDMYYRNVYIIYNMLEVVVTGQYNLAQSLFVEVIQDDYFLEQEKTLPLSIHPAVLAISLFLDDLSQEVHLNPRANPNAQHAHKLSKLPRIIFINLDGFDNPMNPLILQRFPSVQYISIFEELFHPEGQLSFYQFMKNKTTQQGTHNQNNYNNTHPFYIPYLSQIEAFLNEKRQQVISWMHQQIKLRLTKLIIVSEDEDTQSKEALQSAKQLIYEGLIGDAEFLFILEEYIISIVQGVKKVDALVTSFSNVLSSQNSRTNCGFQMTENTLFTIISRIAKMINFKVVFIPRQIVNQNLNFYKIENIEKINKIHSHNLSHDMLPKMRFNNLSLVQNSSYDSYDLKDLKALLASYQKRIIQIFQLPSSIGSQLQTFNNDQSLAILRYASNVSLGMLKIFSSLRLCDTFAKKNEKYSMKNHNLNKQFVASIQLLQDSRRRDQISSNRYDISGFDKSRSMSKTRLTAELKQKEELISRQDIQLMQEREVLKALGACCFFYLFSPKNDPTKGFRYKLVNEQGYTCYSTRFTQHYVDYPQQIVYFFNLVFLTSDSHNDSNELTYIVANCSASFPKSNEQKIIKVKQIADWTFFNLACQIISEGAKQPIFNQKIKQYFLINSTIMKAQYSKEFSFLIFFGGRVNWAKPDRFPQFNFNMSQCLKSPSLYILPIQNESYTFTTSMREIKLFGVDSSILLNLEFSSGVCTHETSLDNNNSDSVSCTMFIFGGSLATSNGLNSTHNMILYSEISSLLRQISTELVADKERSMKGIRTQQQSHNQIINCNYDSSSNFQLTNKATNKFKNRKNLENVWINRYLLSPQERWQLKQIISLQENDSLSKQAQYNLGLRNKILGNNESSLQIFIELFSQIRFNNDKALSLHLAECYLNADNPNQAQFVLFQFLSNNNQISDIKTNQVKGRFMFQRSRQSLKQSDLPTDQFKFMQFRFPSNNLKMSDLQTDYLQFWLLRIQCIQRDGQIQEALNVVEKLLSKMMTYPDNEQKALFFFLASEIYEKNLNFNKAQDFFFEGKKLLFSNISGSIHNYTLIIDKVHKDQLLHLDSIPAVNSQKAFLLNGKINAEHDRIMLIGGFNNVFLNPVEQAQQYSMGIFFYPHLFLKYQAEIKKGTNQMDLLKLCFIQSFKMKNSFKNQLLSSQSHNYVIEICETADSQNNGQYVDVNLKLMEQKVFSAAPEIMISPHSQQDYEIISQNIQEFELPPSLVLQPTATLGLQNSKNIHSEAHKTLPQEQTNLSKQIEQRYPLITTDKTVNKSSVNHHNAISDILNIGIKTVLENQSNPSSTAKAKSTSLHTNPEHQTVVNIAVTSISMRLECFEVNRELKKQTQNKTIQQLEENKKRIHYHSKLDQKETNFSSNTTESIQYNSENSQVIFSQKIVEQLLPSSLLFPDKTKGRFQTAHQNDSDRSLPIFWQQGSTKLIAYDEELFRFIQIQMKVFNSEKKIFIAPNQNSIKQLFFNANDGYIYIAIENEWKLGERIQILRTPLATPHRDSMTLLFKESIYETSEIFKNTAFIISDRGEMFKVIDIDQSRRQSYQTVFIDNENNSKWRSSLEEAIEQFLEIDTKNCTQFQIATNFHKDIFPLIVYIFIMSLAPQDNQKMLRGLLQTIQKEIKKQDLISEITQQFSKLMKQKLTKSNNPNIQLHINQAKAKDNSNSSKLSKVDNIMDGDTILAFLNSPEISELLHQHLIALRFRSTFKNSNSTLELAQSPYKIQFFDLKGSVIHIEALQGMQAFLKENGKQLQYLGISGQTQLFHELFRKLGCFHQDSIFPKLIFVDLSGISFSSPKIIAKFILQLRTESNDLKGVNLTQIFHENSPKFELTFEKLSKLVLSQDIPLGLSPLQVYLESSLCNLESFQRTDSLKIQLESLFGQQFEIVSENDAVSFEILHFDQSDSAVQPIKEINNSKKKVPEAYCIPNQDNIQIISLSNSENRIKDPIFYICKDNCLIFERELQILIEEDNSPSFRFLKFQANDKAKGFNINAAHNDISNQVKVSLPSSSNIKNFTVLQIFQAFEKNSLIHLVLFGIVINRDRQTSCKIVIPMNQEKLLSLKDENLIFGVTNFHESKEQFLQKAYLPIAHNKKIAETSLCLRSPQSLDGYTLFS